MPLRSPRGARAAPPPGQILVRCGALHRGPPRRGVPPRRRLPPCERLPRCRAPPRGAARRAPGPRVDRLGVVFWRRAAAGALGPSLPSLCAHAHLQPFSRPPRPPPNALLPTPQSHHVFESYLPSSPHQHAALRHPQTPHIPTNHRPPPLPHTFLSPTTCLSHTFTRTATGPPSAQTAPRAGARCARRRARFRAARLPRERQSRGIPATRSPPATRRAACLGRRPRAPRTLSPILHPLPRCASSPTAHQS